MKRLIALVALALVLCGNFTLQAAKQPSKKQLAKIEKSIKGYMDESAVAGMSIVLVKGNDVIYQNALGVKDIKTNTPLEIDNFFRIASISKSFSAISILQLVEAGKISLDDDVNDIMGMNIRNPRYPDTPITIKMLLSHTSSMKDGPGGAARYRDLTYIDESRTDIETIKKQAWNKYAPGEGFSYCNRALNLMGCVIEKVSGERFDNYVLNHILRPMGLSEKEAGYNVDSLDMSNAVTLYTIDKKTKAFKKSDAYNRKESGEKSVAAGTYEIGKQGWAWSPTGGMKISAPNLAKWMMTLRDGGIAPNGNRIVSEDAVKLMMTPNLDGYGLCTRTKTNYLPGITLKGHTGSANGLKSFMFFDQNSDWGFVFICSSCNLKKNQDGNLLVMEKTLNLLYDTFIKGK